MCVCVIPAFLSPPFVTSPGNDPSGSHPLPHIYSGVQVGRRWPWLGWDTPGTDGPNFQEYLGDRTRLRGVWALNVAQRLIVGSERRKVQVTAAADSPIDLFAVSAPAAHDHVCARSVNLHIKPQGCDEPVQAQ